MPLLQILAAHSLDSSRDLCRSAWLLLKQAGIPQRMQGFLPAIEPHLDPIAASLLGKSGIGTLSALGSE
jgi:hypothetical protein